MSHNPGAPISRLRWQYTFIQLQLFPAAVENPCSHNQSHEILIYECFFEFSERQRILCLECFHKKKKKRKRFGNSRDTNIHLL